MPASPAPLSALARAWRVLAVLACLGVLTVGGLTRSNDLFPFGVLDQFSAGTDPNGQVLSTCLRGVRDGGEPFEIRFGRGTVGIERADVETQIPQIEADPQRLQPLAKAYDARHPDTAPLDALILCQEVTELRGGIAQNPPTVVELARWEAP